MSDMTTYNIAGYQSFVHQLDPRIRSLRCTKELLEGRKFNIIAFTIQFHKANEHLDKEMPRIVVEFFWIKEIWRLYPTDHPEKRRLIGQAHSPKYEVHWQRRLDADAFKAKRARQSSGEFWSFPRKLSKEEQKDKGLVLIGNHDWEYLLPEVQLMPLYNAFFLELAKVIATNPGKPLGIELMRRLWRLLIREVYDFVSEAERTAKLDEARDVTDEEFEEATRTIPKTLSNKRRPSPESESQAEHSNVREQLSKKTMTVRSAGAEGLDSQIGNDPKLGSSARYMPLAPTNGHQSVNSSGPAVQDPSIVEQTTLIAQLEAKLAFAEQQVAKFKREKDLADHRVRSQYGQLQAAERAARELKRANARVADAMRAENEAEPKLMSQYCELKRAKGTIAKLESELGAEKCKTARLEVSLARLESKPKAT